MVSLLATLACGPDPIAPECVPVDPRIPQDETWCDGAVSALDPELEWDGPGPDAGRIVCVAPDAEGECLQCSREDVMASLEAPLLEQLTTYVPTCELERWEVSCMRTIEGGMFTSPTEYCCYHLALWGAGCAP